MTVPTVHMLYHDDWIVNVLLTDGRVYSFVTEMWPEHGNETDRKSEWTRVERTAKRIALDYASRDVQTWALESLPETMEQFHTGMDSLCRMTNDSDFRRYMRNG